MSRSSVRFLLTVLMYTGVVVFLTPYFTGRVTRGIFILIAGAALTVICGLCRCFLTDGDCSEREQHITKPAP